MRAVFLSPGAGPMYCGNCFRDNALVRALRDLGHDALMAPLYLPLTLDEPDQSAGTPVFYGGINVYLDQKSRLFAAAPQWLRRRLDSPRLLRWAGGRAAKTRASEVGDLALSMLRGEEGRQRRDLQDLLGWLKSQVRPEVVFLSNALLLGLARRIKSELGARVVCLLAGEDAFFDGLPEPQRSASWRTAAERAAEIDLFLAPSAYYRDVMQRRLALHPDLLHLLPVGLSLEGYPPLATVRVPPEPPALGFFARMCREKGLDTLVEAYLILRRSGRFPTLKLRVGGSCGPADQPLVDTLRARLVSAGLGGDAEFHPNLDRAQKIAFLRSLSVFSVPAVYGEAFGLYLIEALAAGVPVVQPPSGAFPEVVGATGGGLVSAALGPEALAEAIQTLLLDPGRANALGETGRQTVFREFSAQRMAEQTVAILDAAAPRER